MLARTQILLGCGMLLRTTNTSRLLNLHILIQWFPTFRSPWPTEVRIGIIYGPYATTSLHQKIKFAMWRASIRPITMVSVNCGSDLWCPMCLAPLASGDFFRAPQKLYLSTLRKPEVIFLCIKTF